MPELTPEYINSITQEELETAGYSFTDYPCEPYTRHRIVVLHGDVSLNAATPMFQTPEAATTFAASHYAPRKLLAEFRARNAALEALVREAKTWLLMDENDGYPNFFTEDGNGTIWFERAAKMLEVGE